MTAKKKKRAVNSDLENSIMELLHEVMNDDEASLTDKMKVIDRALKLEQVRLKIEDEEYGTGFYDDN